MLRDKEAAQPSSIVYDDTPIHVYLARIQALLSERGQLAFSELFRPEQHKSVIVGLFFAILELVRHHGVRIEQNDLHGEIWILSPLDPAELATAASGNSSTVE